MEEIKNMALKIYHAYEDFYLDKEKRETFDSIFDRYLAKVDPAETMDIYEAVIALAKNNSREYDLMIEELKKHSLLAC